MGQKFGLRKRNADERGEEKERRGGDIKYTQDGKEYKVKQSDDGKIMRKIEKQYDGCNGRCFF